MDNQNEIAPNVPETEVDASVGSQDQREVQKNFLQKYGTPISILVGALIIAGSIYVSKGGSVAGLTAPKSGSTNGTNSGAAPLVAGSVVQVSADDDPVLGQPNAPVTLIEFSDFQCPFCRALWRDTLPQIKAKYIDTGKAKLVYRDFPLDIHPESNIAAEAGECAHEQGKFWEFHDKLFAEQDKKGTGTVRFTAEDLKKWAAEIGLNSASFNACFDSGKYKQEIEKDIQDGIAAGVTGTPGTFINGKLVKGAVPFASFQAVIEAELKK